MHGNTKLSVYSRGKMIKDWEGGQKRVCQICGQLGISRKSFYYWRGRYLREGWAGLKNRRCGPRVSPRRSPPGLEERVLAYRRTHQVGPARIALALSMPASTVWLILRRQGVSRLRPKEPAAPARRYEKTYPGALLHVDVKELPQINKGAHQYQFTAVDDYTREAFALIFPDQKVTSALAFLQALLAHFPYPLQRLMTDGAMIFTMRRACYSQRRTRFQQALQRLGIKHTVTSPYRPQSNGKVERFHRTIDEEVYHRQIFASPAQRQQALAAYLFRYNHQRPHLALNGLTPIQRRTAFFAKEKCHQVA